MKIRYLSDLHFEFMPGEVWRGLVDEWASLQPSPDVLVLAGDIGVARPFGDGDRLETMLCYFAERFPSVVYVPGNHEFYNQGSLQDVRAAIGIAEGKVGNLLPLDEGSLAHAGVPWQRFIGTTLWFPHPPKTAPTWQLADYFQIKGFSGWVESANAQAEAFLQEETQSFDVVVTHHLPSPRSIHPKYEGSPLNAFFLCDLERLIQRRQPKLWIHGHTHESCDYTIGKTRVVCNPYGYWGHEVNPKFDPAATAEI